jgi:hypothetical protein
MCLMFEAKAATHGFARSKSAAAPPISAAPPFGKLADALRVDR